MKVKHWLHDCQAAKFVRPYRMSITHKVYVGDLNCWYSQIKLNRILFFFLKNHRLFHRDVFKNLEICGISRIEFTHQSYRKSKTPLSCKVPVYQMRRGGLLNKTFSLKCPSSLRKWLFTDGYLTCGIFCDVTIEDNLCFIPLVVSVIPTNCITVCCDVYTTINLLKR